MKTLSPFFMANGGNSALKEIDSDTLHRLADYFEAQARNIRSMADGARATERRSLLDSRDRLKRRGDLLALADLIRAGELTAAEAGELGFTELEARAALMLRERQ